jgi:hypothetical protein
MTRMNSRSPHGPYRAWIAVVAAIIALASASRADAPLIKKAPDHLDDVTGSCKAFKQAAVRGVRDEEGAVHASDCGYTRFRPRFNGLEQGDFLDAIRDHQLDPPFKVETYPGDTIKDSGRFCARAYGFSVDLSADVEISALEWHHGRKPDSACAKEWNRLRQVIHGHEEKHAADALPVLNAAADSLRKIDVINCAASSEAAMNGLAPQIISALNSWFKSINDDWETRRDKADASGDRCSIDCSKCKDQKISFSNATIDCVIKTPRCSIRTGETIAGHACGDPLRASWTIEPHIFAEGCGMPATSKNDKPFDNDCVPAGSDEEKRRVAVYQQYRSSGAGGWMCVYSDDPRPTVTIRNFRLSVCTGSWEQKVTVDAQLGEDCDDDSAPPPPPPPDRAGPIPNS